MHDSALLIPPQLHRIGRALYGEHVHGIGMGMGMGVICIVASNLCNLRRKALIGAGGLGWRSRPVGQGRAGQDTSVGVEQRWGDMAVSANPIF